VVKGNSTGLEVGFDCFTGLDYLSYSPTLDGKYLAFIQQSPEWKIKHIKSDSYKCGRDAALTILYKDIGDGYYEYKYAICNPKDMFSRKKGVEVALSKPDTWKVYVGNYKGKGVLQVIVWHLPFTGNLSKEVINLLLDEDFYAS
jgi:hypothetical protein